MATKSTSLAKVKAKRDIIKIHVKFTLNTPDGLRRVAFELIKDVNGDVVKWTITFQLFERAKKSDSFGDAIVDLLVEVDSKLNPKAETMADNGMTPSQSAFAIGPAADTAKDAEAGLVSQKKAKTTVQNTLNK
jgi:hypothetical protein